MKIDLENHKREWVVNGLNLGDLLEVNLNYNTGSVDIYFERGVVTNVRTTGFGKLTIHDKLTYPPFED